MVAPSSRITLALLPEEPGGKSLRKLAKCLTSTCISLALSDPWGGCGLEFCIFDWPRSHQSHVRRFVPCRWSESTHPLVTVARSRSQQDQPQQGVRHSAGHIGARH